MSAAVSVQADTWLQESTSATADAATIAPSDPLGMPGHDGSACMADAGSGPREDPAAGQSCNAQWPRFIAFNYPGWHEDAYRPGVNEWHLLDNFKPYFAGHEPPPRPLLGPYDDADPATTATQIALATAVGIEAFMYFTYWGSQGLVMERPMRLALAASAAAARPFHVAGSWCVRLPHDRFPVPLREELDVPPPPVRKTQAAPSTPADLDDVPVELLTLRDLAVLIGDDDAAWTDISVGGGDNIRRDAAAGAIGAVPDPTAVPRAPAMPAPGIRRHEDSGMHRTPLSGFDRSKGSDA